MELVYSIIFLIIGYGFGSFSTGYVVGRMSGHNIQSEGSGNIGTTNALRTMGAKGGALTFAGDLLKAFIPTLLVRFVFCPNMGYSFILKAARELRYRRQLLLLLHPIRVLAGL